MIKDYTEEFNLFTKSLSPTAYDFDNFVEVDVVFVLVQKLYELPINGKLIEEQITRMYGGRTQAAINSEKYVALPTDSNSSQLFLKLKALLNQEKSE